MQCQYHSHPHNRSLLALRRLHVLLACGWAWQSEVEAAEDAVRPMDYQAPEEAVDWPVYQMSLTTAHCRNRMSVYSLMIVPLSSLERAAQLQKRF